VAAYIDSLPATHLLHSGYSHGVLKAWQGAGDVPASSLMFPLFVVEDVRDALPRN